MGEKRGKAVRHYGLIALASFCLFVAVSLGFWNAYELQQTKSALADARWSLTEEQLEHQDTITPDVGSIQFIKFNSFSIELEKATYSADGLYLKGYIGNASQINVSNLTIRFMATKAIFEMRKDYDRNTEKDKDMFGFFGFPTIGTAQSAPISILLPGSRQEFEATIPNVKQTANGGRIEVEFTGERYSYPL